MYFLHILQHNQKSLIAIPLSFNFCHVCALIRSFIFAPQSYYSPFIFHLCSHLFDLISCLIMSAFLEKHLYLLLIIFALFLFFYGEQICVSSMTVIHFPYELLMFIFKKVCSVNQSFEVF